MIPDRIETDVPISTSKRRLTGVWLWAGIGAAGLIFMGVMLWQWRMMLAADGMANREELKIAKVELGEVRRTAVALGKIVVANSPTLYASADGVVTYEAKAGDSVTQGQRVAKIESPSVTNLFEQEKSTLARLQADLVQAQSSAKTSLFEADSAHQEADLVLRAADRSWQRSKIGIEKNFVSKQEYERAEDDLAVKKLKFAQSAEQVKLAKIRSDAAITAAKLLLERQQYVVDELQRRVDELNVLSPVDGIIGNLALNQKSAVARYQALLTVVDLSRYEGEVMVAEHYARDLTLGMDVDITLDNREFKGSIAAISPEIQGGQVQVRLRFSGESPTQLRQNQRISTTVVLETHSHVVRIPRALYLDVDQGQSVFKVLGDKAIRVPITLGATNLENAEVTQGLVSGDEIIISDTTSFRNYNSLYIKQ